MLPLNIGSVGGVYVASFLYIDDTPCQLSKDVYHRGDYLQLVISVLNYVMQTTFFCRQKQRSFEMLCSIVYMVWLWKEFIIVSVMMQVLGLLHYACCHTGWFSRRNYILFYTRWKNGL